MKHRPFLLLVAAFAVGACASDGVSGGPPPDPAGNRTGYQVVVNIQGKAAAFSGTTVEVGGKRAPAPTTAGEGDLQIETTLCTANRQKFLGATNFTIAVTRADGMKIDNVVERLACRLSRDPGVVERIFVLLREDGHVDARFGSGDARVFAACEPPNRPGLCPRDDF